MSRSMNDRGSVPRLRLPHRVPDLGAAVGAFIDEVDLRHAPMWLDVPNKHGQHSDAAGADNRSRLIVLVMHVGWHIGSPSRRKQRISTPAKPSHVRHVSVINSCEQTRNSGALSFTCGIPVTFTHAAGHAKASSQAPWPWEAMPFSLVLSRSCFLVGPARVRFRPLNALPSS
jgi:hypothetical protein